MTYGQSLLDLLILWTTWLNLNKSFIWACCKYVIPYRRHSLPYWKSASVILDKDHEECELQITTLNKTTSGENKIKLMSLLVSADVSSKAHFDIWHWCCLKYLKGCFHHLLLAALPLWLINDSQSSIFFGRVLLVLCWNEWPFKKLREARTLFLMALLIEIVSCDWVRMVIF